MSLFNSQSRKELMDALEQGINQLSSSVKNRNIKKGEQIILFDNEAKEIFGATTALGPPILANMMDARNIYSNPSFNKYEIPCSPVYIFPIPLKYSEAQELLGIERDIKNSFEHFQHLSQGGIRKFNVWSSPEKKESIEKRLLFWMKSLPI